VNLRADRSGGKKLEEGKAGCRADRELIECSKKRSGGMRKASEWEPRSDDQM